MVKFRLGRYTVLILCGTLFILGLSIAPVGLGGRILVAIPGLLFVLGIWDLCQPWHSVHRISTTEVRQFDQVHHFLKEGQLVRGECELPYFRDNRARARADSFAEAAATIIPATIGI